MVIVYEVGAGLYVNMTNRCSNACEFCVRQVADGTYGELWLDREPSCEELLAELEKNQPADHTELVFCGYGEPTERFDDMLCVAKEMRRRYPGLRIRLNTNGHANLICRRDVTPEFAGVFDSVSISLNAANAKDYVKICVPEFGEAAFDGLLDFAQRAKQYVPQVQLSVVRESIPDSEIVACQRLADACGIPLRVREMIRN